MKILRGFVFMLLIIGYYSSQAQYNTGDPDLDKTLITLDLEASMGFGAFRTNIIRMYNVSDSNIQYLTVEIGMTAGDIYLTMEIAKITQKSINQVVESYLNLREKGWGAIAMDLGIIPGSAEFDKLKDKLIKHA
jgi:hypothetical protein